MLPVMDVAVYVINYSNDSDDWMSNLKLQKILYFIQAYYLSFLGKPCFEEEIYAYEFGPVIPSVYEEFKSYGGNWINAVTLIYRLAEPDNIWSVYEVAFYEDDIPEKDREIIRNVVDTFKDYTASDLTKLTINQFPWKYARNTIDRIISKESIKDYFYKK